jgi:hypothetical protein
VSQKIIVTKCSIVLVYIKMTYIRIILWIRELSDLWNFAPIQFGHKIDPEGIRNLQGLKS